MSAKLAAYTRRAGVDPVPVVAAYQLAVRHRLAKLDDIFHPQLLHPARTVLILLEDVNCAEPVVLAAAALIETELAGLRIGADQILTRLGPPVADLVAAVPAPAEAGELLLEQLLCAPHDVALIALAERLDHARHLKFRDRRFWRPFFTQINDVYVPVSARINDTLTQRFTRWSGAFEKRLLSEP